MRQERMEVWLVRGDEMRRLHGQCPTDAETWHPNEILVALQKVENGLVVAWAPIFRRWMTRQEAERLVAELVEQGWTTHPRRPMKGEIALNTTERVALAREKDKNRKRITRAWNQIRRAG